MRCTPPSFVSQWLKGCPLVRECKMLRGIFKKKSISGLSVWAPTCTSGCDWDWVTWLHLKEHELVIAAIPSSSLVTPLTLGQQDRKSVTFQPRNHRGPISPSSSAFLVLIPLPLGLPQLRLFIHQHPTCRGELQCGRDKAGEDTGDPNYLLPSGSYQLPRAHPLWNQWALSTDSGDQRQRHRNEGKRTWVGLQNPLLSSSQTLATPHPLFPAPGNAPPSIIWLHQDSVPDHRRWQGIFKPGSIPALTQKDLDSLYWRPLSTASTKEMFCIFLEKCHRLHPTGGRVLCRHRGHLWAIPPADPHWGMFSASCGSQDYIQECLLPRWPRSVGNGPVLTVTPVLLHLVTMSGTSGGSFIL